MRAGHGGGRKVLVIDDDSLMRALLKRLLQGAGYEMLEAESGEKGLELARRELPNLIIMDCIMPEMDGLEAVNRLKAEEATKSIPVVIVTGHADRVTQEQFILAGAVGWLPKPFHGPDFLELVRRLVP